MEEDGGVDPRQKPFFGEITGENVEDNGPVEVESLCMDCERNGKTRLLLTKIPMFKEVVVSSFHCPHCGASNSSIQSGAAMEPKGVKYKFSVQHPEDLNRLIVKADTATVCVPELDFEIPPSTNEGSITTIESILLKAAVGLEKEQPVRKALNPDLAAKLDMFIQQLRDCVELKQKFTFVIDDPAGNSYVENKLAPMADPSLNVEHYSRSEQQDKQLGANITTQETLATMTMLPQLVFLAVAFSGRSTDIPHFKQVVIMATTCNYCGYNSNEVKSGCGVSETGTRTVLRIANISDLNRDVIFSETCVLHIPSLDFECSHSSVGGRFTTVEGMLSEMKMQLQRSNPFLGDSVQLSHLTLFLEKLSEVFL
ncbi:Zinc finger protein ZPR1 [Geodia barretti]|uniref:Zinc finger protein ZPR1 n=1 Tax=Geodia barretti TaxID=519541 RepID=A0AA35QS13_GEOBA|nr:Zinc finger protein ZPR1 [Geodia barretti]